MKKTLIISVCIALIAITSFWIVKANPFLFKLHKPTSTNELLPKIVQQAQSKEVLNKTIRTRDQQLNEPFSEYLVMDRLRFSVNNNSASPISLDILVLNTGNIENYLGSPISKTTEYDEYQEGNVITYTYNNGVIHFLNDSIIGIDINGSDWAFKVTKDDGNIAIFTWGSGLNDLGNLFPTANNDRFKTDNGDEEVRVTIKTASGVETDAALVFTISNIFNTTQISNISFVDI